MDEAFEAFVQAYPVARRQKGYMASFLFIAAAEKVGVETLMAALAQHKRSIQWQTSSLIPMMRKWLEEERWIQELPEPDRSDRLSPWEKARASGYKTSTERMREAKS